MNMLKSLLASTLFSTQVLGAGDARILPQEPEIATTSLTIQDVFDQHMGPYSLGKESSKLVQGFRSSTPGMEIFSFLTAEELQKWITAFASLVPKTNRLEFIKSMNINFFGGLYPRATITRISRPRSAPNAYVPFKYATMQKIFSRFRSNELQDFLMRLKGTPQKKLFLIHGIGCLPQERVPEIVKAFFKNPSIIGIPQAILFDPKVIQALGPVIEREEFYLTQDSKEKVIAFYALWNEFSSATDKFPFVENLPSTSQEQKDLKAFGYSCLMNDSQISMGDKCSVASRLKFLDLQYEDQAIAWYESIMNNTEISMNDRCTAANHLKGLGSQYDKYSHSWYVSITNNEELSLDDRYTASRLEKFRGTCIIRLERMVFHHPE